MADHLHQPKRRSMESRFYPTSREVIKYLLGFVIDERLPGQDQVMQVVDVYSDKEPWEIVEGTDTHYLITPLKKEKEHHKRSKRSVGDGGTWKTQDAVKEVFDDKGRLMGYVHHFKYTPRPTKACPNKASIIKELFGEWLMTEYTLYDGYVRDIKKNIKNKGIVICKIKKKKEKLEKDESKMSEVEVDEFINSILQKEDINNKDGEDEEKNNEDVGDEVLALLGCNEDDEECMNSEENIGISKNVEGDHDLLDAVNRIDLEDYEFV